MHGDLLLAALYDSGCHCALPQIALHLPFSITHHRPVVQSSTHNKRRNDLPSRHQTPPAQIDYYKIPRTVDNAYCSSVYCIVSAQQYPFLIPFCQRPSRTYSRSEISSFNIYDRTSRTSHSAIHIYSEMASTAPKAESVASFARVRRTSLFPAFVPQPRAHYAHVVQICWPRCTQSCGVVKLIIA